ncbi:hypothetical protein MLD38_023368 [Melastoma candidum]|uniref:Uncharacterized protein n=1 Tax=Melastoma candidum TaxID=119954 RepID=A0ACB9QQD2_9MYRT|nr:hypothetical protein MLD38_023368 [Melastoma candidum]
MMLGDVGDLFTTLSRPSLRYSTALPSAFAGIQTPMALAGEVGLQLLLCPLSSNIVVRTACCSVGIVLPVYSTFKAIEGGDEREQKRWLLYWAAYGSFSLAEVLTDKLLFWFPAYYYMKFAFLVWLQLPSVEGAKHLYSQYLRPLLLNHQTRLDQIVEFVYGEMTKFVHAHQSEFMLARKVFTGALASARQMLHDSTGTAQSQANRAIEGPNNQTGDSRQEHED